jgi:hypothetical protein
MAGRPIDFHQVNTPGDVAPRIVSRGRDFRDLRRGDRGDASMTAGGRMVDLLGYSASLAVLITFLMPSMSALRLIAIISNVLFVLYGYSKGIYPVLLLHTVLLPINTLRLIELRAKPDGSDTLVDQRYWLPSTRRPTRDRANQGVGLLGRASTASGAPDADR